MKTDRNTLYMYYPSSWWHELWREGLFAGNGMIGANNYGGTKKEVVIINHHDLWYGGKHTALPDVSDAFVKMRKLMDEEKFREANSSITDALKERGYEAELGSCLPLADLEIEYFSKGGFSDFLRWTQMDTGEIGMCWQENKIQKESKLFVSRADDMLVKQITASNPVLSAVISLDIHKDENGDIDKQKCTDVIESKENHTWDSGLVYCTKNSDGSYYGAVAKVVTDGEKVEYKNNKVHIQNAKNITIFIKVFVKQNKEEKEHAIYCLKEKLQQLHASYEKCLERHVKIHKSLFESAALELDYEDSHSNEELLMKAFQGEESPEMIEKMWKYGRYLFISGTCAEANPFPLYGLWQGDYGLMWCHNMANINIQMVYWHSFAGNLLDYNKAFFHYFNERMHIFQENAKKIFGLNGIYVIAGTTPDMAYPNQIVPVIINWVGAAGWLAHHYYQYYCYTKDKKFMQEEILPFLEETATFYQEFIKYYDDGTIKFYPSISPENTPENFMPEDRTLPHPMPTTINATIDLAIIKEFFGNIIKLAEEELLYLDKLPEWKRILNSIGEYKISRDGGVREWQDERFEDRYDHRHLSHLYPLFPGNEVNTVDNATLIPVFEKAVALRQIDAQTGWSLSFMANVYARLEKGEKAIQCLNDIEKSVVMNNFVTLHNDWRKMNVTLDWNPSPVQLDANMGYVNAVQEMLLYSSGEILKLLPALPKCMKKGRIKSFRYQDGEIDMDWDMNQSKFICEIRAIRKHKVKIQLFQNQYDESQLRRDEQGVRVITKGNILLSEFEKNGVLKLSWRDKTN